MRRAWPTAGVLTTAFDEAMSALNWLLYRPAVTGRLEVDFRRPVPVGSQLSSCRPVGASGRKAYAYAEGRLAPPTASSRSARPPVFIAVPLEHFELYGRFPSPRRERSSCGCTRTPCAAPTCT